MKSLIIIALCLAYTLSFSQFRFLKDDNQLGLCVSRIHRAGDNLFSHAADLIDSDKSDLEKIETLLQDLSNFVDDIRVCKQVKLSDVLPWIQDEMNDKQSQCATTVISLYHDILE